MRKERKLLIYFNVLGNHIRRKRRNTEIKIKEASLYSIAFFFRSSISILLDIAFCEVINWFFSQSTYYIVFGFMWFLRKFSIVSRDVYTWIKQNFSNYSVAIINKSADWSMLERYKYFQREITNSEREIVYRLGKK